MYLRNKDQEITPVPTILAVALACLFATLITIIAMVVFQTGNDTNAAQTKTVETLSR